MQELKRLSEQISVLKDFFEREGGEICDLSLGVRYMWQDDFEIEYAIENDTLIMKESTPEYQDAFYYPIGDEEYGLNAIEEYCKAKNKALQFCCINKERAKKLSERYYKVEITSDRDWSDYIYDVESFKTYSGKRLSGQRNHVNKFKRKYPNYQFRKLKKTDGKRIAEFLLEYNGKKDYKRWTEQIEQKKIIDLIENMDELNQEGGLIELENKVLGFSIVERIDKTLFVHVEKGLTEFDGIYPTLAQEIAKTFGDGIKYINREEDCGDAGLRTSKLQYKPLEIRDKLFVKVKTAFDSLPPDLKITTERLEISPIEKKDKPIYYALNIDDQLNKWWGYDYREDLVGEITEQYFYDFQDKLRKRKEEFSLAIRKDGRMLGELVVYNFDYSGGLEIGFRLLKENQNKGYATESAKALIEYIKEKVCPRTIRTRCYKENKASYRLIKRLGFIEKSQDKTHYYFILP